MLKMLKICETGWVEPLGRYRAIVHLTKEKDGTVCAVVPRLPGCVSQGGTVQEALANIKKALEGCCAVYLSDPQFGGKIPWVDAPDKPTDPWALSRAAVFDVPPNHALATQPPETTEE